MALANQTILKTFEQSSVAWQTIPHWNTRDPGQVRVRSDIMFSFEEKPDASIELDTGSEFFDVTLALTTAATPDALLAKVIARTVGLAKQFDGEVFKALEKPATEAGHKAAITSGDKCDWYLPLPSMDTDELLKALLDGRKLLEDSGYRAQSCLVVSTKHYAALNRLVDGAIIVDELLLAAKVNSLHRASQLDSEFEQPPPPLVEHKPPLMLMLGRRQDIAHGCAPQASAGEEPVDLAVSVLPSLEVVGDNDAGKIEMAVRVRYATRVKDDHGIVVFHS
jgi:hypothetical protein